MISKRIIIMISVVGFFFFHSFITYFTCALNNCTEQASVFSCAFAFQSSLPLPCTIMSCKKKVLFAF